MHNASDDVNRAIELLLLLFIVAATVVVINSYTVQAIMTAISLYG